MIVSNVPTDRSFPVSHTTSNDLEGYGKRCLSANDLTFSSATRKSRLPSLVEPHPKLSLVGGSPPSAGRPLQEITRSYTPAKLDKASLQPMYRFAVGRMRVACVLVSDLPCSRRSSLIKSGRWLSSVDKSKSLFFQKTEGVKPWDHPSLSSPAP